MSTSGPIRALRLVPDVPRSRGLLDTSVVIDLEHIAAEHLPARMAISAITLAELAAGPHATTDAAERARRQDRLQRVEATFDAIPFDDAAARAYGHIHTATVQAGPHGQDARLADLLTAAVGLANDLPVYTRHREELGHLGHLVELVAMA
jgi:predicted nucleic acid-binding protein